MSRAAPCLDVALAQLNALAPNRRKDSDGGAASAGHTKVNPTSDHEPDIYDIYHARDFTHDPANGADMSSRPMRLMADRRAKYVIFDSLFYDRLNGKIRVRNYADVNFAGWKNNKHDKHLHLSVNGGALGNDMSPWNAFNDNITNVSEDDDMYGPNEKAFVEARLPQIVDQGAAIINAVSAANSMLTNIAISIANQQGIKTDDIVEGVVAALVPAVVSSIQNMDGVDLNAEQVDEVVRGVFADVLGGAKGGL